jgi:hypothetical protein
LDVIQRSSAFRIGAFDTRAAIELAQMTNASLTTRRERREAGDAPWSKIRFDRQIVAIAKVYSATTIYSDDENLITFAEQQGIPSVRIRDLPIPESARQPQLPLTPPSTDETPA